jgi:hypothetical protein
MLKQMAKKRASELLKAQAAEPEPVGHAAGH